jgi:hypothetical protein
MWLGFPSSEYLYMAWVERRPSDCEIMVSEIGPLGCVVWTSLGPLPRWVPGPTTRWAPGTTRLALHGT